MAHQRASILACRSQIPRHQQIVGKYVAALRALRAAEREEEALCDEMRSLGYDGHHFQYLNPLAGALGSLVDRNSMAHRIERDLAHYADIEAYDEPLIG